MEAEEEKHALLARKMEKAAQLRDVEERVRRDEMRAHGLAKSLRRTDGDGWLGSNHVDHALGSDRHDGLVPKQHGRFLVRKGKRPGSLGRFLTR